MALAGEEELRPTPEEIAAGGDPTEELSSAVKAGVAGASTGISVATAAAAGIGLAVGAAFGPFAAIAAPIGAAVGALIGFFIGLGKAKPTKEELAAARAAQEKARLEALNKGWVLSYAAQTLSTSISLDLVSDDPIRAVERTLAKGSSADALRAIRKKNPQYEPLIDNLVAGLRWCAAQPDPASRVRAWSKLKTTVAIFQALGSLAGDLQADPFAYFRPPLRDVMASAFAAAGLDINDPAILAKMQLNYDVGAALAAQPRASIGAIPIRRRSVGLQSGGRIAVDNRGFSRLAPYGVGSFRLFPQSVPPGQDWRKGDDTAGVPLESPWPWGLDADRFALPPRPGAPKALVGARQAASPASGGQPMSAAEPLAAAGLVGLLWWLL